MFLSASQLPCPAMLRQSVPCRPAQLVGGSLAYSQRNLAESSIPTELQREVLADACSPDELQASARLKGNRLAFADVKSSCLAAHPVGRTGERLCLSVLAKTPDGRFQVCRASSPELASQGRLMPAASCVVLAC